MPTLMSTPLAVNLPAKRATPLVDDILRAIAVEPPYFALADLHEPEPGILEAVTPVESPLGAEVPPISTAEAGRHLAILGECVAARPFCDAHRRYYLVTAAHVVRPLPLGAPIPGRLVARAKATSRGNSALARATLRADGQDVCRLNAHYNVMTEQRLPLADEDEPPEAVGMTALRPSTRPPPVTLRHVGRSRAVGTLAVAKDHCLGHLVNHPRLPLAVLMSGVTAVISELLRTRYDDPELRYAVLEVYVRAAALSRPGDVLRLAVELQNSRSLDELLAGNVVGPHGPVASILTRVRVLPHGSREEDVSG